MREIINIINEASNDDVVERAAKALERFNKSAYGWSDEDFEIWWNRDRSFVEQIRTWETFAERRRNTSFIKFASFSTPPSKKRGTMLFSTAPLRATIRDRPFHHSE